MNGIRCRKWVSQFFDGILVEVKRALWYAKQEDRGGEIP